MSKKFYIIDFDHAEYTYDPATNDYTIGETSRHYYVSSAAKSVDPTDIQYAKLFPSMRSAKQAWIDASQNPKYYEVEVDIKIVQEVKS